MQHCKLYIVGGGTFAAKLAVVLLKHNYDFIFIDEMNPGPICDKPVVRANSTIIDKAGIFFLAISLEPYDQHAIERLTQNGIDRKSILRLRFETAVNMLDLMLTQAPEKTLQLIKTGSGSVTELEKRFFQQQYAELERPAPKTKPRVGFYFNGKGGGFRKHVCQLPAILSENFELAIFSDQVATEQERPYPYYLMSEELMQQCTWPDLVINPHFVDCSPAHITKLTMMHMVYDFLVHKDLVARVMAQANNHYIFIPSAPSMELHKSIYLEYGLTNNVVLIPGGYPRHDENLAEFSVLAKSAGLPNSILYAPTLSALITTEETKYSYSILEMSALIPEILESFPDKHFIFRPHPDDLVLIEQGMNTRRAEAFRNIIELCRHHPRCSLDTNQTQYLASFAKSFVIISDTSAIAFSFALITKRPVIFFSRNQSMLTKTLPHVKYIQDREKIGYCVENKSQLIDAINAAINKSDGMNENQDFIESIVFNPEHSMDYLQKNLHYILSGKRNSEWWYLQDHISQKRIL